MKSSHKANSSMSSKHSEMSNCSLEVIEPLSDDEGSSCSFATLETTGIVEIDKQIAESEKHLTGNASAIKKSTYRSSPATSVTSCTSAATLSIAGGGDIDKYKNNFVNLYNAYKLLETEHMKLVRRLSTGKSKSFTLKTIQEVLDPFALKIALRKEKNEKAAAADSCGEGFNVYVAKKWKIRYYNILDAVDLLYKDYQMIGAYINSDTNIEKILPPDKIMKYIDQILNCFNFPKNFDELHLNEPEQTVTLSTIFVTDLVGQLRAYQHEVDRQLRVNERLFQILKKAKEQRTRLKGYVTALRDELRYVEAKQKETEDKIATNFANKQIITPTKVNVKNGNNNQLAEKIAQESKKEIMTFQGKISDLEKLLKEEEQRRKKLHNKLQEIIGNIRVYCRIRPQPDCFMRVQSDDKLIVPALNLPERITKNWGMSMKCFIFDKVFDPKASQEQVFEAVEPLITSCVDGYNVCIMAYGQTGSGKTYTMMGTAENPGVNRRAISELLRICKERKQCWTYSLNLCMVEIYQEDIKDLLGPTSQSGHLNSVKLLSSADFDVIISGATEYEVKSEADILRYFEFGEKNRSTASTSLNVCSSRSHLILILKIDGLNNIHKTSSKGILTLCDLAGSENVSKSGVVGERFQEATCINKSLTTLGRVLDSLRKKQKPVYRETKLTHLLKPTLGGDAKCLMFVNVRSDLANIDETLRALQFGTNAMQVAPENAQQKIVHEKAMSTRSTK